MTQQPYGQPYTGGGAPQQQYVAPTGTADDFFDGVGEAGAPSFKFNGVNDGVRGTIVSQYRTVVTDTSGNTKFYPPKGNQAPQPIPQLNVTLQTSLRNWDKVNKVPVDDMGNPKPPSEDDGLRRIYIKYDMRRAVGVAIHAAKVTGGLKNGGELAVKLTGYKPTNQPNDLPLYEARYTPPSESAGFDFGGGEQQAQPAAQQPQVQQAPPVQQQPQAAPQQAPQAQGDPWASQPAAPAQGDPWATQGQSGAGDPPF